MSLGISVLDPVTPEREKEIESFMWDGVNLKLHTLEDFEANMNYNEIAFFCLKHGLYQLPTKELIEYLRLWMIERNILPSDMLEIGAGSGQIGRHLGIRMTDSKMQDEPEIAAYYNMVRQPRIKYGPDVEKIDANSAVKKYQPKAVLGCWVTEFPRLEIGVREKEMLAEIQHYIFVGNRFTHAQKTTITTEGNYYPWIISRSIYPKENRIWQIK